MQCVTCNFWELEQIERPLGERWQLLPFWIQKRLLCSRLRMLVWRSLGLMRCATTNWQLLPSLALQWLARELWPRMSRSHGFSIQCEMVLQLQSLNWLRSRGSFSRARPWWCTISNRLQKGMTQLQSAWHHLSVRPDWKDNGSSLEGLTLQALWNLHIHSMIFATVWSRRTRCPTSTPTVVCQDSRSLWGRNLRRRYSWMPPRLHWL